MGKLAADRTINTPLGLGDATRPRRGFAWADIATGSIALALVAVSAAVSMRDRPFRTPSPVVVSEPRLPVGETVPGSHLPPARDHASADARAPGPSIIRVEPPADGGEGVIIIRDPSAIAQNPRTAHLPDRALIEDGPHGPLPIRSADGRRPFDVYARPWSGARGARVAIVVGGLGVSQTGTQQAIDRLPPEVTLAFASGGNSLDRWMQAARREGHELLMQVPMEPFDYPSVDPGRDTLTVDAGADENRDRLHRAMSRITNYTGVMNYMGARFVTDEASMAPVFDELGRRGLMYLDDGSAARTLAPDLAARNRVPYAAGQMQIDGVRERGEILKKLDDLERTARAQGSAIGLASAFDVTVETVATWVSEARRRGIEIVPVSALAFDPERN